MSEEVNASGAKGFRIDGWIENFFDGVLNKLHNFISPQRFDLLGNLVERIGYYAVAICVVLVLVMAIGLKCKGGACFQLKTLIFFILVAPVLLYAAVKFSRYSRILIAAHPTTFGAPVILRAAVLATLALGLASLVFNVLMLFSGANLLIALFGLIVFLIACFLAALPLLPETVNVTLGEQGTAAETALELFRFLGKALLKAAPVLFGLVSLLGMLAFGFAVYLLFFGNNQELGALNICNSMGEVMFYAILTPALAVIVFLMLYLILDVISSLLKGATK